MLQTILTLTAVALAAPVAACIVRPMPRPKAIPVRVREPRIGR